MSKEAKETPESREAAREDTLSMWRELHLPSADAFRFYFVNLGLMYEQGDGVAKDMKKAGQDTCSIDKHSR